MAVKLRRVIIAARFRGPCPEQATPQETRAVLAAWAAAGNDQQICETRAPSKAQLRCESPDYLRRWCYRRTVVGVIMLAAWKVDLRRSQGWADFWNPTG